jgi:hypothetical protein
LLSAVALPKSRKEAKVITLPKQCKDPKLPPNLRPISLLSTTGKQFEKVILKLLQKHIEEKGLFSACQFAFRACHSTTLLCMRITDHVTLNFNNKIPKAAVFLDIKKAFDIIWHSGFLHKLSKLEFSTSLIKLIGSFLLQRKFKISVEGEMSTPRVTQVGVPQGSFLSPTLFNVNIHADPQTRGVHLTLFSDDTCLYATDRKEFLLSENSSAVSSQWRPSVSAGISKLMKIRLGDLLLSMSSTARVSPNIKWTRYSICK